MHLLARLPQVTDLALRHLTSSLSGLRCLDVRATKVTTSTSKLFIDSSSCKCTKSNEENRCFLSSKPHLDPDSLYVTTEPEWNRL